MFGILLPLNPLCPSEEDPVFSNDLNGTLNSYFYDFYLIDHDEIENRNMKKGLRKIKEDIVRPMLDIIYRGWMINIESYTILYNNLLKLRMKLINNPIEYATCHHLPLSYPLFSKWMPRTKWIKEENINSIEIKKILQSFGPNPIVIKDYVKSQAAGYWNEACFIPNAIDYVNAFKVINRFMDLQGKSLAGGLVFRSYHPLRKSEAEVIEWRAFFYDKNLLGCWPRHNVVKDNGPPISLLNEIAQIIPSKFATADFALCENDDWMMIETGDGQVSSFPKNVDLAKVFLDIETLTNTSK